MSEKLAPCPFCGGEASLTDESSGGMAGSIFMMAYVECNTCHARGSRFDDWGDPLYKDKAINAWNSGQPKE